MLAKVLYDGKVHRWSKPYLFFDVRPRCKVEKRVMVGSLRERESVCVCVCVRERERERERKGQGIITFEQFYKLKSKSIKEEEKEKFKIIMHFCTETYIIGYSICVA